MGSDTLSSYENLLDQIIKKRKMVEDEIQTGPSEFVKHLVKNLKLDKIESKNARLYSNNMANACKTICKICKEKMNLNYMRRHTKKHHNITIKEYRGVYGDISNIKKSGRKQNWR